MRREATTLGLDPLHLALSGGDDYELCFTLPVGEELPADCAIIGSVEEGEGVSCDVDPCDGPGFQHF